MTDEVHGEDYRGKDRDKDQQAPTSAQTIFAEKNLVEGRLAVQVVLARRWVSAWHHGPKGASFRKSCCLVVYAERDDLVPQ